MAVGVLLESHRHAPGVNAVDGQGVPAVVVVRSREQELAVGHQGVLRQDGIHQVADGADGGAAHTLRNANHRRHIVVDDGLARHTEKTTEGGKLDAFATVANGAVGVLSAFLDLGKRGEQVEVHAGLRLEVGERPGGGPLLERLTGFLVALEHGLIGHVGEDARKVAAGVGDGSAGGEGGLHEAHLVHATGAGASLDKRHFGKVVQAAIVQAVGGVMLPEAGLGHQGLRRAFHEIVGSVNSHARRNGGLDALFAPLVNNHCLRLREGPSIPDQLVAKR